MRYFLQELQENTQLCNLVGEISHAIGHCYHNLSDLMIDLNQPRPRHLYAAFVSPPVQTTLIHQQTIPVHINAVSGRNYRFCFPTTDLKKWRHSTVFRNFIQCMFALNFTVTSTKKAKSTYADDYINFYIHPHSSYKHFWITGTQNVFWYRHSALGYMCIYCYESFSTCIFLDIRD